MLYQIEWTRLFIVLIPQSAVSFIYLLISYKLLHRRKDQLIILLVSTYITLFLVSLINNSFVFLLIIEFENSLLMKGLYYILSFLTLFGFIFLLLFIVLLYKTDIKHIKKTFIIIIIINALNFLLFLFIPDSISFNINENWNIQFSIFFTLTIYIYFALLIAFPIFIFSNRIYLSFEDNQLKKRFKFFMIGVFFYLLDLYGAILYNTWHNSIYRSIWSIITFILLISSSILIYYGIVKSL